MFERDLTAAEVGKRLGLDKNGDFSAWLEELESIGPAPSPVSLPDRHEIDDLFARLGISIVDAAEIIAVWPRISQAPEWRWLLQHCHQQLMAQIGTPYSSPQLRWKPLPAHLGAFGRLFYVYVFFAALPAIRQWHHEHGIPDDVSWAILGDLGEHIAIYRRIFGVTGLDVPQWFTLHFSGKIYRLGRLQFERRQISFRLSIHSDNSVAHASSLMPHPGDPTLAVHIPESGGPFSPAACSASFERARSFFARYFPEEPYRFAICSSWLLDPQLADYLPPTSNIISFQRRFQLIPEGTNDDQSVIRFVFRRTSPSLDELPQRTTLERAVVAHLRAGGHWQFRTGWFAL
jgi:hypothetical protein